MGRRTARMFQKGHIIMRGDPAWGEDDAALSAKYDTFYYTNAAPQLGFFNQGSEEKRPGSKGTLRWRAVETYILRSAVTMRQRVSVFAGPIFDDGDPDYRMGSKVPMRFWKIAVWADQGELRSIAVVADQRPVLEELTKGMPEAMPEAFEDEDELARMTEFLATGAKIERWTKLDFGEAVREAGRRSRGARPIHCRRGRAIGSTAATSPRWWQAHRTYCSRPAFSSPSRRQGAAELYCASDWQVRKACLPVIKKAAINRSVAAVAATCQGSAR